MLRQINPRELKHMGIARLIDTRKHETVGAFADQFNIGIT